MPFSKQDKLDIADIFDDRLKTYPQFKPPSSPRSETVETTEAEADNVQTIDPKGLATLEAKATEIAGEKTKYIIIRGTRSSEVIDDTQVRLDRVNEQITNFRKYRKTHKVN